MQHSQAWHVMLLYEKCSRSVLSWYWYRSFYLSHAIFSILNFLFFRARFQLSMTICPKKLTASPEFKKPQNNKPKLQKRIVLLPFQSRLVGFQNMRLIYYSLCYDPCISIACNQNLVVTEGLACFLFGICLYQQLNK